MARTRKTQEERRAAKRAARQKVKDLRRRKILRIGLLPVLYDQFGIVAVDEYREEIESLAGGFSEDEYGTAEEALDRDDKGISHLAGYGIGRILEAEKRAILARRVFHKELFEVHFADYGEVIDLLRAHKQELSERIVLEASDTPTRGSLWHAAKQETLNRVRAEFIDTLDEAIEIIKWAQGEGCIFLGEIR